MQDVAVQMEVLDDFVVKARSKNTSHHERHLEELRNLSSTVRKSSTNVQDRFESFDERLHEFREDVTRQHDALQKGIGPLSKNIRNPLMDLQEHAQNMSMTEYNATGTTPPRTRYEYPTILPRTEIQIAKLMTAKQPSVPPLDGEDPSPLAGSPSKTKVYNDAEDEVGTLLPTTTAITSSNTGLREVDINVVGRQPGCNSSSLIMDTSIPTESKPAPEKDVSGPRDDINPQSRKRPRSPSAGESKLPQKVITRRIAGILEGRENIPVSNGGLNNRRLRNRPST